MVDPQTESVGTTHTYVARAWYRDTAIWFNLASFAAIVLQETTFQDAIPARFHPAVIAAVTVLNLLIRFHSSTRPVALAEGTPVQVQSIQIDRGKVSDTHDSRQVLPIVLLALALGGPMMGCAKAPPTLSPAGVTAYKAQDVVRAIAVLRDAATAANAQNPPLISTANTRKVVNFHEAAIKTIDAAPGGWKPTVKVALDQLQHDILPAEWNRLLPYVSLIKSLIDGVTP